jgi:hypothetical protein
MGATRAWRCASPRYIDGDEIVLMATRSSRELGNLYSA